MDRKKAIEYLKKDLKCYDNITGSTDAVNNCSGSCDSCPNYVKAEIFYPSLRIIVADAERRIKQSKQKIGRWVNTEPNYKSGFGNNAHYCSECKGYYTTSPNEMHYCPNCGAEMVWLRNNC